MQEQFIKQIKGQVNALRFLKAILKAGRLSHSYIFSGPSGVGKMSAAIWFAAAVLCESSADGTACGECLSCRTIAKGNYPYLNLIAPEKSTIKINQIRSLNDFLKYKVERSVYRFIIIDEAETLTPEAANSLLKILEEPPERTTFILLADNIGRLFPTIISRCQVVNFTSLSRETISEILVSLGVKGENIAPVLPVAQGSVGRALELIEDEELTQIRLKIIEFLKRLPLTAAEILEFAQECSSFEASVCLAIILSCYRDFLVLGRVDKGQIINHELLNGFKPRYDRDGLSKSIEMIMDAQLAVGQNANKQLVLENLFLELNGQAS